MKKLSISAFAIILTISFLAAGCSITKKNADQSQTQTQSSTISYKGEDGKTALELLKSKYKVETQSFSSGGEFVKTINGTAPDSSHYWSFYINGVESSVGAGSYTTKSSDTIEWKLKEINKNL